jgi:hypothetical protein
MQEVVQLHCRHLPPQWSHLLEAQGCHLISLLPFYLSSAVQLKSEPQLDW